MTQVLIADEFYRPLPLAEKAETFSHWLAFSVCRFSAPVCVLFEAVYPRVHRATGSVK